MSLPRYPKYRNSGVEWLGDIPGHWDVWKLAHAFKDIGSGTTPKSDNTAYYDEGKTPWLNTGDLNDGELAGCDKNVTALALKEHTSLKLYPENSVAIAMYGATIGKLAILRFATTVNQACCVFGESQRVSTKFLFYWLLGLRQQIISLATGGGQPNISQDILRSLRLACPNLDEQHQIVTLLDREISKIDALISEQEKLITLLAEKRHATISHAVTKGLNQNAPMKDSGVEWLGEIPENWEVAHLKRFCGLITDGAHISPETENGIFHFVSTKDVIGDKINFDGALLTSESNYDYLVKNGCKPRVGDVLFSKDGTIGRTVVVSEEKEFVVASSLIIIRPNEKMLDYCYLNYLCKSSVVSQQVEGLVKGAGLPRLSIQNLLKVLGVFPPLQEQRNIAAFLETEVTRFSELSYEAGRGIILLKERRSALISAAVTGKIDVRHAVQQESAIIQEAA